MNFVTSIKKLTSAVVLAGFVSAFALAASPSVSAIPYQGDNTPGLNSPAFNVFTGTPSVGDEADFLRGREEGASTYVNNVNSTCKAGQRFTLRVYVHNAAKDTLNNGGSGPGVAHNTKVRVALPSNTTASNFNLNGTISSSNAGTISDGMSISCGGKTVKLSYVAGSAQQFSMPSGTKALSDSIVTTGAPIGTMGPNGDVWGCWNQRVWVALTLVVKEAPKPAATAKCELFTIVTSDNRKVTVDNFKKSVTNGAAFKQLVINWGDNTSNTTITDESKVVGTMHTYGKDGTFLITAIATFSNPNGADITSGGAGTPCAQKVTFSSEQPPTVEVPPTELVNTGPGEVAALFAGVTAIGSLAYRWVLGRRLG